MCGINGIFSYNTDNPVDDNELLYVREYMHSRGPDGCGVWFSGDKRIGLAHRRLAIIDLSETGAQPMSTPDGNLHIIFNGEIYNYKDLRKHLIDKGYEFHSQSDTEVLLYLYSYLGENMVYKLRGMFAFAIFDKNNQKLFLARDPYGIKPLYYSNDGKVFRFASQVKALQSGGAISKRLDPAGIVGFLLWGSVPEPLTVYEAIKELPAGNTMTVTPAKVSAPKPYWDIARTIYHSSFDANSIQESKEKEYVRNALIDTVKAHLVADVPVGAFLSGGKDSTAIVGLCKELGADIETVTLAFDEFKGSNLDESEIAKKTAQILGVRHKVVLLSMKETEENLDSFYKSMDQPTINGLNTWFVCKAASKAGLKVALSGLGGDELFGGYSTFYKIPKIVSKYRMLCKIPFLGEIYKFVFNVAVLPFSHIEAKYAGLLKYSGTYSEAYQLQRGVFMPWQLAQILDREFVKRGLKQLEAYSNQYPLNIERLSAFGKIIVLESTRYMRNQLLRDTDWISMAHSLEVRVPFVDVFLIEEISGLSAANRLGKRKDILISSLSKKMPKEVFEHPKTGFTIPFWKWLRKLPQLDCWKRVRLLKSSNIRDECRMAYCVLSQIPEAKDVIKK